MEFAPVMDNNNVLAGDRSSSSIASKRNLFEQPSGLQTVQSAPPPRPPQPKKPPARTIVVGNGSGSAPQASNGPAIPPRKAAAPKPVVYTESGPTPSSAPPPRPLANSTFPKRSPSAPSIASANPMKKAPAPPPPPPSHGIPATPVSQPSQQPKQTAPKKLAASMIPPGLVVSKSAPTSTPSSLGSTSTQYGTTPPSYSSVPSTPTSSSPSATPIPPPNPFASRPGVQVGTTPPLSPTTPRAQVPPIPPSVDNTEKKESFFNSLFFGKKKKEKDISIGSPFNVAHRVHVNYNTTTGFEGLPPEWEAMLKSSGISKEEVLDNSDAVLSVLEFQAKRLLPTTPQAGPSILR